MCSCSNLSMSYLVSSSLDIDLFDIFLYSRSRFCLSSLSLDFLILLLSIETWMENCCISNLSISYRVWRFSISHVFSHDSSMRLFMSRQYCSSLSRLLLNFQYPRPLLCFATSIFKYTGLWSDLMLRWSIWALFYKIPRYKNII